MTNPLCVIVTLAMFVHLCSYIHCYNFKVFIALLIIYFLKTLHIASCDCICDAVALANCAKLIL